MADASIGPGAVPIVGLADLQRAFSRADKTMRSDLRDALSEAAAPVRADAKSLTAHTIRHLFPGDPWTGMRIGVTGDAIVYVAPIERGVKVKGRNRLRRPNLANLLMDRAMEPALKGNTRRVEQRVMGLVDEVCNVWERT